MMNWIAVLHMKRKKEQVTSKWEIRQKLKIILIANDKLWEVYTWNLCECSRQMFTFQKLVCLLLKVIFQQCVVHIIQTFVCFKTIPLRAWVTICGFDAGTIFRLLCSLEHEYLEFIITITTKNIIVSNKSIQSM